MKPAKFTVGIVAAFVVTACQNAPAQNDAPAIVTDPTPESRAELLRVVTTALNGARVRLADDALTSDSLLIVEREQHTGREFGRPDHFRLMKSGSRCVLEHQGTGGRWQLTETTCARQ